MLYEYLALGSSQPLTHLTSVVIGSDPPDFSLQHFCRLCSVSAVHFAKQMVAICLLLLLEPGAKSTLLPVSTFMPLAKGLLSVSTILTVTSGAGYLKAAWPALMGQARTKF